MAGKLSCLQLFLPFIYLFFFTVLNITSLSLLLEAKCFQWLGLHFRLSKELLRGEFVPRLLDPGKQFLGLGRRGSGFTSETWFWCCADCTQQHPLQCLHGRVQAVLNQHGLDTALSTALSWSWASEVPCCPADLLFSSPPQQLPERFGWAAWLWLLHLSNPWRDWPHSHIPFPRWWGWDGYATRCSSVGQPQVGPLGPGCVLAGSWWTLTVIKLKSCLLSAETTKYSVISMLT